MIAHITSRLIKTAVIALEAYWLAEIEVQADVFNKEDHVHHILVQTRCSLGRIFAPRHNNKPRLL